MDSEQTLAQSLWGKAGGCTRKHKREQHRGLARREIKGTASNQTEANSLEK